MHTPIQVALYFKKSCVGKGAKSLIGKWKGGVAGNKGRPGCDMWVTTWLPRSQLDWRAGEGDLRHRQDPETQRQAGIQPEQSKSQKSGVPGMCVQESMSEDGQQRVRCRLKKLVKKWEFFSNMGEDMHPVLTFHSWELEGTEIAFMPPSRLEQW